MIALDATNGKRVWDRTSGDVRAGESATCAPLVVKNMVIVGSSGRRVRLPGHLDAFDVDSGEHQWRCYMVPKPGEPGSETWPADGEAWQRGGANCWLTGTFDPDTNLLYWGTGNPAPDFERAGVREGDNLYTDSVVAVDADAGQIRWHYQCTPHDVWDYDSIAECILFEKDGRKLLGHFDKNGYFFVLDRTNGERVSDHAVRGPDRLGWITREGQVTARCTPTRRATDLPGSGRRQGMDPTRPTARRRSSSTSRSRTPARRPPAATGSSRRASPLGAGVQVDIEDMAGSISAFDANGDEKWRWRNDLPMCASVLATGGDLVFTGTPSGEFVAVDARSGEQLWKFQCGSGHHSSPSTYSVDGRQYIVVPVGWGGWAEGFLPGMLGAGRGSALMAFALPEWSPCLGDCRAPAERRWIHGVPARCVGDARVRRDRSRA